MTIRPTIASPRTKARAEQCRPVCAALTLAAQRNPNAEVLQRCVAETSCEGLHSDGGQEWLIVMVIFLMVVDDFCGI